jgi:hypothetical protein
MAKVAYGRIGNERVESVSKGEISKMRIPYRRRLVYVSTVVLLIIYASAIILLILSFRG